jgi:hypothetical protein
LGKKEKLLLVHVDGIRLLLTAAPIGYIIHGEPWWNYIGREKPKISERKLFQCRYVHHKSHMD